MPLGPCFTLRSSCEPSDTPGSGSCFLEDVLAESYSHSLNTAKEVCGVHWPALCVFFFKHLNCQFLKIRLSANELMLLNCGVGEDS